MQAEAIVVITTVEPEMKFYLRIITGTLHILA